VSVVFGVLLAAAGLSSLVKLRDIGGDPAKLEQARRIEANMNADREARERLLEGEPPARPPAPAVRVDGPEAGVRPVSVGSQTGR
jgi:hypothetical protein